MASFFDSMNSQKLIAVPYPELFWSWYTGLGSQSQTPKCSKVLISGVSFRQHSLSQSQESGVLCYSECKIAKNFQGFAPAPHWGGLTAQPQTSRQHNSFSPCYTHWKTGTPKKLLDMALSHYFAKKNNLCFICTINCIPRPYFRKIKCPGIGHFIIKCPFWKKFFFLDLNQKCQKQLPIGGISPPYAILDNPGALLLKEGPFFKNNLIQFFILNKQFLKLSNFSFFK